MWPRWSWGHATNKKRYISTSPRYMTVKLGKIEIYSKEPPFFGSLCTWSNDHVTDKKHYISASVRPIVARLDRVLDSNADLLSTKSFNLLITWSHKVIWQIKNAINAINLRFLWQSSLTEGWLMVRSHMSNSKVTYPSDNALTWGHVTNELHYVFFQILTLLKNSFEDDSLFLKLFNFCFSFINCLANICVD